MRISFPAAVAGLFLGSLGLNVPLWAASSANVGHEPLGCVPARGNARVVATFKLPDSVTSARVYFRRDGQTSEYFLEMRRGDLDRYWALLPPPEEAGGFVAYRVVGRDGNGNSASTPLIKAPVSTSCAFSLSEEERRAARNIVLGLTAAGQTQNPTGFGCEGIVGQISPLGELRNVTPCSVMAGGSKSSGASRDVIQPAALTASSPGFQSTTAASCGNPDGLTQGGRGGGPTPTPTRPPLSFSRPNPSPN